MRTHRVAVLQGVQRLDFAERLLAQGPETRRVDPAPLGSLLDQPHRLDQRPRRSGHGQIHRRDPELIGWESCLSSSSSVMVLNLVERPATDPQTRSGASLKRR